MVQKIHRPGVLQEADRQPTSPAVLTLPPSEKQKEIEDRAKYWGIPIATFNDMNFDAWDAKREGKGLEEATEYAVAMAQGKTEFNILTLAGPRGVGKTHLALAVAWDSLMNGFLVYYRQAAVLLDELRYCFSRTPLQIAESHDQSYEQKMDMFMSKGLLIIDDLGAEKPTEWAAEKMDLIIDYRWLNRLPLMVTTNALSEDLPPRIADRISDVHRAKVVTMIAKSYRLGG